MPGKMSLPPVSAINPRPNVKKTLERMASGDFGALKLSEPPSPIQTKKPLAQVTQDTVQFSTQITKAKTPTQPISDRGYKQLEKDTQTSFLTKIYDEKTTPKQREQLNKDYNRAMAGIRKGQANPATIYGQQ